MAPVSAAGPLALNPNSVSGWTRAGRPWLLCGPYPFASRMAISGTVTTMVSGPNMFEMPFTFRAGGGGLEGEDGFLNIARLAGAAATKPRQTYGRNARNMLLIRRWPAMTVTVPHQ